MPKRCVEIWYNILEEAVGNLSSPKYHPLSSGTRIHSNVCYTCNMFNKHRACP